MKKGKGYLNVIKVNVAIIAVGIIILELIFGNWINPNNLNRLKILRNVKRFIKIGNLYPYSQKFIVYTRDQYGLRGNFQNPREIDILTVGGSTTDQRYITDGETWQDVIEKEFQAINKKVVIANAGIDGQSTYGNIKNFDLWFPYIPELKPKYVLFLIGSNDFYKDEGFGYDRLIKEKEEKSFIKIVREKSVFNHVFRVLKGVYDVEIQYKIGHESIKFDDEEWTTKPLQNSHEKMMQTRLKEYEERLDVLIQKVKEFGSIPIFVTQPSRKYRYNNGVWEGVAEEVSYDDFVINGVDYLIMMKKLNQTTIAVCLKHNLFCIDLARESFWKDEDFYDFTHMTPVGAEKTGSYLFERIKKLF